MMQEDASLSSTNKMLSGSELRMSDICHVDLQQLGKNNSTELCLQYGSKGIFVVSPILYPHSILIKDTL
jgi:hypothetical protein